MFEPCVLGVDPGIASTGLAAVGRRQRRAILLWTETVRTPAGLAEAARLRTIHEAVRAAIATHRPSSVAVERVAWNTNQVSALRVARATGVVLLAAAEAGLTVEEYGPLEVKMAVTGSGTADKAAGPRRARRAARPPGRPAADGRGRRGRHRALPPVADGAAARRAGCGAAVIAFLEGELADKGAGRVVVAVHGVGYDVQVPASTIARLPGVGERARLLTRLHVRDDGMTLFGFATADERTLFDLLVTVTGVGPKVALSFLSVLSPEAIRRAVAAGDVAALTIVPGVGKKVAQRVVLDLKTSWAARGCRSPARSPTCARHSCRSD